MENVSRTCSIANTRNMHFACRHARNCFVGNISDLTLVTTFGRDNFPSEIIEKIHGIACQEDCFFFFRSHVTRLWKFRYTRYIRASRVVFTLSDRVNDCSERGDFEGRVDITQLQWGQGRASVNVETRFRWIASAELGHTHVLPCTSRCDRQHSSIQSSILTFKIATSYQNHWEP